MKKGILFDSRLLKAQRKEEHGNRGSFKRSRDIFRKNFRETEKEREADKKLTITYICSRCEIT